MANPLLIKKDSRNKFVDLPHSAGILDDYAVRKNVATKEGTIEKVPVNSNDIVNKAYADSLVASGLTAVSAGGFITVSFGVTPLFRVEIATGQMAVVGSYDSDVPL